MLRLIHNQTIVAGILVDDIDDGLPNKETHRLGSLADPKAYERDGYAEKPKQACYVPFSQAKSGFPTIAGYVNLNQTNRVNFSAGKGKIFKLSKAAPGTAGATTFPLVTVVSLTASQIVAPVATSCASGVDPVVVHGTTFLSVQPDITSVTFAKAAGATTPSPATFTAAQVIAGGGSVTGTAISIPAAMFTGQIPATSNTVFVTANEQNSNTVILT